jgi:hypothetical protein
MNCQQAQEQLAARWVAGLDEPARMELDDHLALCPDCRAQAEVYGELWHQLDELPAAEPGPRMAHQFGQLLEAYRLGATSMPPVQTPYRSWFGALGGSWLRPLALAGLALVFGAVAGHLYTARTQDQARIETLTAELRQTRQLAVLSLLQQPSASERLRGVSFSQNLSGGPESGPSVATALLDTLNHDPNVNVRLAAIDALKQFGATGQDTLVRSGLSSAIAYQNSPLVQVALIEWAIETRNQASRPALELLQRTPDLNPIVEGRLVDALARLQ